ncbi:rod shape-determining protein RodA [Rickettsiales endosymbiont of Stachyamoeba lipophora]|nr:rod shape-determining protein RodA [Rickettsiales endosymbiont of Stachyamoeba lipophora]
MIFYISIISVIGFFLMYSAAQGSIFPWTVKQLIHFSVGFVLMLIVANIRPIFWYRTAYLFYFGALLLLVLVEVMGHTAMGATRWLQLGPIKLQPAELMKIAIIFALGRYFHNVHPHNITRLSYILLPLSLVALPFILILKQPDLGTAMILLLISGIIFFAAGVAWWKFATVFVSGIIALPVLWTMMHDYQKQRILIFLNPEMDKLGAGYNIIQSEIAIGSGGFLGKGLLNGTQVQLSFLPEHQTDFIFTMLSEELGFVGSVTVITLYAAIIFRIFTMALNSKNTFNRLLIVGVMSLFGLHVVINTSMVMGLIPVVGVPLPLLTYGGTIMLTTMFGFGLIFSANLYSNKFDRDVV